MAGVTSVVIDGTTYLVDDINAVDFSEDQGLSEQQQQQGRSNIGAAADAALAGLEDTVGELSDDVDGLTEALADKASAIVDTASGAIASFMDGAAVAAKDITIAIEPVQSGSGDPSPTNVRPITGWTGANVTRTGFNVWDEEWELGTIGTSGQNLSSNSNIRSKNYIPVIPGSTYWRKSTFTGYHYFYDANKNYINNSENYDGGNEHAIVIPDNAYYMRFYMGTSYGTTYNHDISINYPSTDHDYHASTGITYPISWQSEAGTVYGGTLDVTTGLLTVDAIKVTTTWGRGSTSGTVTDLHRKAFYPSVLNAQELNISQRLISKCNIAPTVTQLEIIGFYPYAQNQFYLTLPAGMPDSTAIEFFYPIQESQTYQLSPTDVALLLGVNNVWADTGDSTVAYRADTKLYIQKINVPTDDDMIADAQIASGKYFIVGGNLYKSTTTIPAGDTITPGTNCILTNLADALNALNT